MIKFIIEPVGNCYHWFIKDEAGNEICRSIKVYSQKKTCLKQIKKIIEANRDMTYIIKERKNNLLITVDY